MQNKLRESQIYEILNRDRTCHVGFWTRLLQAEERAVLESMENSNE